MTLVLDTESRTQSGWQLAYKQPASWCVVSSGLEPRDDGLHSGLSLELQPPPLFFPRGPRVAAALVAG